MFIFRLLFIIFLLFLWLLCLLLLNVAMRLTFGFVTRTPPALFLYSLLDSPTFFIAKRKHKIFPFAADIIYSRMPKPKYRTRDGSSFTALRLDRTLFSKHRSLSPEIFVNGFQYNCRHFSDTNSASRLLKATSHCLALLYK